VDSSFVSDLALKGAEGSTVVLVNGAFRPDLSSISGLPAGVYIGSIAQAPKEAADLIVSTWGQPQQGPAPDAVLAECDSVGTSSKQ
jgi:Fe-S cluster assembly protein SufD